MSFADVFNDLGRFVKDPEVRWEYCIRAKRGQFDTGMPGKQINMSKGKQVKMCQPKKIQMT